MQTRELGRIFDGVAERYDAVRPGYPAATVDDLTSIAGLDEHSSVLEVACGTGQLTVPLARTGASVTAVEIGPRLAAIARRNLADHPNATVHTGAFEDLTGPAGYDVVVVATAWHWLDPATRVDRCARLLRPGGALAVIDTVHVAPGTVAFFHAVQACYEAWDPATPPGLRLRTPDEIPTAHPELDDAAAFGPVDLRRYTREIGYTTEEYLEVLLTYSGHLALPDDRRAGLLTCIRNLIDSRFDGHITKAYLTELRVLRHRSRPFPTGGSSRSVTPEVPG